MSSRNPRYSPTGESATGLLPPVSDDTCPSGPAIADDTDDDGDEGDVTDVTHALMGADILLGNHPCYQIGVEDDGTTPILMRADADVLYRFAPDILALSISRAGLRSVVLHGPDGSVVELRWPRNLEERRRLVRQVRKLAGQEFEYRCPGSGWETYLVVRA